MNIVNMIIAGALSTMNIWTNDINDIRMHLNDVYMVLLMICWMYLFDSNSNILLIGMITTTILLCIRNQYMIDDAEYLNGMIPHHSMAILMSKRILDKTSNCKIRKLANEIIKSQENEIELMKNIYDTL